MPPLDSLSGIVRGRVQAVAANRSGAVTAMLTRPRITAFHNATSTPATITAIMPPPCTPPAVPVTTPTWVTNGPTAAPRHSILTQERMERHDPDTSSQLSPD